MSHEDVLRRGGDDISYKFRFSWPFYPTVDIRDDVICGELFKLCNCAVLRNVRENEYVRPIDIVQYCAIVVLYCK